MHTWSICVLLCPGIWQNYWWLELLGGERPSNVFCIDTNEMLQCPDSAPTENEKSGVWAKQGQKMKEALLKYDIPFSIESCLDWRSHKDPHKVNPRKSDIEPQNHPFGNKENHFKVFTWLLLLICSSFGKGLLVIQAAHVSSSPSAHLDFLMMPMFLARENRFSPMPSPPHWPKPSLVKTKGTQTVRASLVAYHAAKCSKSQACA